MMHSILRFGRHVWVFMCLTAFAYLAGMISLYFKGETLEYLMTPERLPKKIMILVFIFSSLHLASSLLKTVIIHWRQWLRSYSFEGCWQKYQHFEINAAQAEHPERVFQAISVYEPTIQDMRISIFCQVTAIVMIFLVYLFKVIYDQFWLAFAFFPFLTISSWVAGATLKDKISHAFERHMLHQNRIMRWCRDCFLSYRERRINWRNHSNALSQNFANDFINAWRKRVYIQFLKALTIFTCVDFPFIFSMAFILLAAGYGKIGLADVVVWIGLVELLVEANNLIAQTRDQLINRQNLEKSKYSDLAGIGHAAPPQVFAKNTLTSLQLDLLDGSPVSLGLNPGFYRIQGKNGSGKSTLLTVLLGLEDRFTNWDARKIYDFAAQLEHKVRIIERHPVVFSNVSDFATQITGLPASSFDDVRLRLTTVLANLLPDHLETAWGLEIELLASKWLSRNPSTLSSGEAVVLSWLRALIYWDEDVRCLVIDEVESTLDSGKQQLFQSTLEELSKKFAVYYVSHIPSRQAQAASFVGSAFALGYSQLTQKAIPIELRIAATYPGTKLRKAYGTIGTAMLEDLDLVLQSLMHSDLKLSYIKNMDLHLECDCKGASVSDSRSSRLAIAVALLNIHRRTLGFEPLPGIAATGFVRLDGGIDPVDFVEQKARVVTQESYIKKLITPQHAQHLTQVFGLMGIPV